MSVFHTCSLDWALYPNELEEFVGKTESITMSGNSSKGEYRDACLGEVNKDSKVWQHGVMVATGWEFSETWRTWARQVLKINIPCLQGKCFGVHVNMLYSRTPQFRTRLIQSPCYFEWRSNSLGFTLIFSVIYYQLFQTWLFWIPRYFKLIVWPSLDTLTLSLPRGVPLTSKIIWR